MSGRALNVNERARKLPGEYESRARRLDFRFHGVGEEDARGGPVLAALRAWPDVVGLVFGAFGEASQCVEEIAQAIGASR